ncbi:MBL fold metallo-hydrolase [Frateuria aurantia]
MRWSLRFLGTGAAHAVELGSAAAVIERDGRPLVLIDCGPDALDRYREAYAEPPRALYLTHIHMDHVAGMERLFFQTWFGAGARGEVKLLCHAALVPWLQSRIADYPGVLAEGGVNYWDAFRLTPCSRGFWLEGHWFEVFATRHHRPGTSFGLRLPGSLVYTGDTRPIPEQLALYATSGEPVAHDCGLIGNPSHTGLDDLAREYPAELRARLLLYHYGSRADGQALAAEGYRVAWPGEVFSLPSPQPATEEAG